jgi:hypothetical protein
MANNVGAQLNQVSPGLKDQIQAWSDSYEKGRQQVENFACEQLPWVSKELIAKVTKCASEILIDLWIVSGVFILPPVTIFAVKRLMPIAKCAMEYVKRGSTAESKLAAWNIMKQEYKDSLRDTIAPALLVALSVTAVFWVTYGLVALKLALLAKGACLLLPTCFALYELCTDGKSEPFKPVVKPAHPPESQAEKVVEHKHDKGKTKGDPQAT